MMPFDFPWFQRGDFVIKGPTKRVIVLIVNALAALIILGYISVEAAPITALPKLKTGIIALLVLSSLWVWDVNRGI